MPEEQKAPFVRIKVLHGTDVDRRLANDIDDSEFHVTTDQFRAWIGKFNLLSGHPHHGATNQAARLTLRTTEDRGCYPGDTCKQSDNGKIYQCISNEGQATEDWLDLTDHPHTLTNITDAGTAAGYDVPASGNAASGQVVLGNDSRLYDPRTPTAHGHTLSDISDAGTAAGLNVPASGDAASGEVVKGNDSRLSDPRTPTAHTHDDLYYTEGEIDTQMAGKSDTGHGHTLSDVSDAGTAASKNVPATGDAAAGEAVLGNDSRLSDPRNPTAHTHDDRYYTEDEIDTQMAGKSDTSHGHTLSDVSDAGTAASKNVPATGDAAAGEAVLGNDSRLSDPRNPTAHTHDDRYYTEDEIDTQMAGKANTSHGHTLSDVSDAGTAASRDVPSSGDATSTQCVLGNDSRLGAATGVLPIGGIFAYDTGISGASYSTSIFARCEGGSYPDLRDKFIMGSTTSGGEGGSTTHSHTVSITTAQASPCSGSGVEAVVGASTSEENHLPPYRKEIMLCRYA